MKTLLKVMVEVGLLNAKPEATRQYILLEKAFPTRLRPRDPSERSPMQVPVAPIPP